MTKARPTTAAGRRRVERAFERHGLLLTQGQWEIPSIADLLAGKAIETRGYSWDYVPAWDLSEELEKRRDVARAKLFRGRTTLIAKRLWPAVDALARDARERIRGLPRATAERLLLEAVEAHPGIAGGELRSALGLDPRAFQRLKGRLEQKLGIFGIEREDLAHHTHESSWFPWSQSKIASGLDRRRTRPESESAIALLLEAAAPARPDKPLRPTTLFPVLRPI